MGGETQGLSGEKTMPERCAAKGDSGGGEWGQEGRFVTTRGSTARCTILRMVAKAEDAGEGTSTAVTPCGAQEGG